MCLWPCALWQWSAEDFEGALRRPTVDAPHSPPQPEREVEDEVLGGMEGDMSRLSLSGGDASTGTARVTRKGEAAIGKKPLHANNNRRKQLPPNVALALNGSMPTRGAEDGQRFYTDDGFADDTVMNPFLEVG